MGPLASIAQRDEVLRQVAALAGGRRARSWSARRDAAGARATARRASPEGAFVAPMLLRFADAAADAVHEVEAFGPVASLLTYDTVAEAAALVARGGGSLVTSIATHDPASPSSSPPASRRSTAGCCCSTATTPARRPATARPLPNLVHGGPGRAGGGEELGGIRAVLHHMQRTAVQGSPEMLTALTGVWHAGATHAADGRHPFRKSLAELRIGDQIVSASREVTLDDIETFAHFTGDTFYAHMDEDVGSREPVLPGTRRARLPARLVGGRASSSTPSPARCSRTTGSRTCGSSPPSRPATRSGSSSRRSRSRRARPTSTARCGGTP